MSTVNQLTKNYSGIFGNMMVARNRNGKTILTIPENKPKQEVTENQMIVRRRFSLASRYAKSILSDPDKLAAYSAKARPGLTPYTLAIADYLKPPYVEDIDASEYHGNPGDKIRVTALDDFELTGVMVKITDAADVLLEEGPCIFNLLTGNYDFTATLSVPNLSGTTITAKATDTPGHTASYSITL